MNQSLTDSRQETFDFVVNKLRQQGKPSMDETGANCVYRAPDGSKCAAGHLIPDDEYDPDFEGKLIGDIYIKSIIVSKGYDISLVENLQSAHDRASLHKEDFMNHLEKNLQKIAERFNLTYKKEI